MAFIRPFRGLRPIAGKAGDIASPPYDVLDSEEAREDVKIHPHSFLHVIKPEIDMPSSTNPYGPQVYAKGRENLNALIEKQWFVQDERPCFYIYQLKLKKYEQTGLVAVASIDDYVNNIIKEHENTREKKEQDRTDHIRELNAQTGLTFLLYRDQDKIDALIEKGLDKEPAYDFIDDREVRHRFYLVDDPELIRAIQQGFAHINSLYVADGHHRIAAAVRVRDVYRKQNPHHTGDEAYNFFLCAIFPESQVNILDYNRVVRDLNGLTSGQFIEKVKQNFEVEEYHASDTSMDGRFKPQKPHEFGMYLKGQWYRLTAREGTYQSSDPVEKLDVAILQNNLILPVLGIENPRIDERIEFVGGIRGLGELERLVDKGDYAVAFSMYPIQVDQLMIAADAKKMMLPKSTWFEPKLASGLVVHKLGNEHFE